MTEQPVKHVDNDGNIFWYLPSKGKEHYHRLGGPAIELTDGANAWYVNGKQHRLGGPAYEHACERAWYIDDKELPEEEVEAWLEENDIDLKTEQGQMAFKLKWS